MDNGLNMLLELDGVAEVLKCNLNQINELIVNGQLQGIKLGSMKISTLELEQFLNSPTGKGFLSRCKMQMIQTYVHEEQIVKGHVSTVEKRTTHIRFRSCHIRSTKTKAAE